jgi:hypothetical protein
MGASSEPSAAALDYTQMKGSNVKTGYTGNGIPLSLPLSVLLAFGLLLSGGMALPVPFVDHPHDPSTHHNSSADHHAVAPFAIPASYAAGAVTVTGVAANHSSATIFFNPVAGAKDYRVFDINNPNTVKYAGRTQGSNNSDPPVTHVEWNALCDGQPHTLVVQAVDQLGPVPHASLYNQMSQPLVNPMPAGAMLGTNKGATSDGKVSINGQGPYTNTPQVIAQSQPFIVQANRNYKAIPSKPTSTQGFFDTFENSEGSTIVQTARNDGGQTKTFNMNAGTPLASTIFYQLADTLDSMPFIGDCHFMDMLFDGGTPGTGNPLHQGHGVMGFKPNATADFSNGRLLHATLEVDGLFNTRRWMDIVIVPANDPIGEFSPNDTNLDAGTDAFNNTNRAVRLQLFDTCTLDIYTGPPGGGKTLPNGTALWGAPGQAADYCGAGSYPFEVLDRRSRYDFFLSQNRAAFFKNGELVVQSAIPAGSFSWANQPMKVYFSHYTYHTDNDVAELRQFSCSPLFSYWFNDPVLGTRASDNSCNIAYPGGYGFPHSDERHWDNMGFEVLPASDVPPGNDWSSLRSLVQLPPVLPPNFVGGPPPATPTAAPTGGSGTATRTPSPTRSTATPAGTPGPATMLVGHQSIEATRDNNSPGVAQAFQYTATASGTADRLNVYLDSTNTATQVVVGLYSNAASNNPGTLLAQATLTNPASGAWNAVTIPATPVQAGTAYWIAVLAPTGGGTVQFRNVAPGAGGKSQISSQTTLSTLPAAWSGGTSFANSPMSAYAAQVGSGAPPPTATRTTVPPPATATVPPSRTATAAATRTATRTATAVPTATVQPSYTSSATVSPSGVARGSAVSIVARVTSATASNALVDVEVYDPAGSKVFQQFFDNQTFAAGQQRQYTVPWTVPTGAAVGTYRVKIGVFNPGWGTLHDWEDNAGQFTVR